MKIHHYIWLLPLMVLTVISPSFGARGSEDGSAPDYWSTHALVVAQIRKVLSDTDGNRLEIQISSVLSTRYSIPITAVIPYRAGGDSSLHNLKEGITALLCLEHQDAGWTLPAGGVTFMPSGIAVSEVKDENDPKVAEIEKAVRDMQATKSKVPVPSTQH